MNKKYDFPYPEKTETWHPTEGTIAFLEIHHDDCPPDPCEDMDGFGKIHSFSTKHSNHLKLNAGTREEAIDELTARFGNDWVQLGYFEHGRCLWHVADDGIPRGTEGYYRWDGTRFAGAWVPDDELLSYVKDLDPDERQAKLRDYARQACETFTQWCNGEVYGFNFSVYAFRDPYDLKQDYRFDDSLFEDSCWGYYGWDYFEDEVRGIVDRALDDLATA